MIINRSRKVELKRKENVNKTITITTEYEIRYNGIYCQKECQLLVPYYTGAKCRYSDTQLERNLENYEYVRTDKCKELTDGKEN